MSEEKKEMENRKEIIQILCDYRYQEKDGMIFPQLHRVDINQRLNKRPKNMSGLGSSF